MNLRQRVRRLEKSHEATSGSCRHCANEKWPALTLYTKASLDAEPVLAPGYKRPAPCPACGKMPPTVEIVEVVVHTREEAEAALALNRRQG